MSYKKAGCFLIIWFCLFANMGAVASTRIITCREQRNQVFVCIRDAAVEVSKYPERQIRLIGYGKNESGEGRRIAAKFRRQLIDEMANRGMPVDPSLFVIEDGGVTGEAKVEVYVD